MGPPLGKSRLIRPVVLAALLITSIHLRRDKAADADLKLPLCDLKAVKCALVFCELGTSLLPFKRVLAFCPEEVNMGLELQFEDVLLVDAVGLLGGADCVAEQWEAGEREVVLQTETFV